MKRPKKLYRYRPLDDGLLERELNALYESYLFSPPFASMNDPMEAFYEMGGPSDRTFNALLTSSGKKVEELYKKLSDTIDHLALVSFASSHNDLPMWAYYASNFAGMCLEFDSSELAIGDFQNEKLWPVTYSPSALPSLTITDLSTDSLQEAVIARITRKRIEWKHEKEWRFITGQVGRKYYLDDALRRIFLGPRVKPEHAVRVCELMDQRPVEVLQGKINGFDMHFQCIKPARPLVECERIGVGKFDPVEHLDAEKELRNFLIVPFEELVEECYRTSQRPNMEELAGVGLASSNQEAIYLWTIYKLRSGRDVYHKRYFDRHLHPINLGS